MNKSAPADRFDRTLSDRRHAYVDRMFEGREAVADGVPEDDLFLVATAHCLMADDYERAIDFACVLADRQVASAYLPAPDETPPAADAASVVLPFPGPAGGHTSRRGSS